MIDLELTLFSVEEVNSTYFSRFKPSFRTFSGKMKAIVTFTLKPINWESFTRMELIPTVAVVRRSSPKSCIEHAENPSDWKLFDEQRFSRVYLLRDGGSGGDCRVFSLAPGTIGRFRSSVACRTMRQIKLATVSGQRATMMTLLVDAKRAWMQKWMT